MNPRENFYAALQGKPHDRVPLWMREGFGSWYEPDGRDEFLNGWMGDPKHRHLQSAAEDAGAVFWRMWEPPMLNRFLMTSPAVIHMEEKRDGDTIRCLGMIETPKGDLHFVNRMERGIDTVWHEEVPVKAWSDVEKLLSVPFKMDESSIDSFHKHLRHLEETSCPENTQVCVFIPSPIVTISRCMPFADFLEKTIAESEAIHEILDIVTQRMLLSLDLLMPFISEEIPLWLGGSEQCTPPMMGPLSFDEFVKPYDGRLVRQLKEKYGRVVGCHCHGRVAHALSAMVEMGFDATDPVEPPPQGDVELAQAFSITGNRLTLIGNMQYSELEHNSQEFIREKVRTASKSKEKRLILGASAGPMSAIDDKLLENYLAWFDEYRKRF